MSGVCGDVVVPHNKCPAGLTKCGGKRGDEGREREVNQRLTGCRWALASRGTWTGHWEGEDIVGWPPKRDWRAKRKIVSALGRGKAAEVTHLTCAYRLEHKQTVLGDDVAMGCTDGSACWRPRRSSCTYRVGSFRLLPE